MFRVQSISRKNWTDKLVDKLVDPKQEIGRATARCRGRLTPCAVTLHTCLPPFLFSAIHLMDEIVHQLLETPENAIWRVPVSDFVRILLRSPKRNADRTAL